MQNMSHLHAVSGFVVTDRNGEFLCWSACVLVALKRHREDPRADRVTRCSDDAVMCYRRKRTKRSQFEAPEPAEQVAA